MQVRKNTGHGRKKPEHVKGAWLCIIGAVVLLILIVNPLWLSNGIMAIFGLFGFMVLFCVVFGLLRGL